MNTEIERKFLVKNDHWKRNVSGSSRILQGYLGGNAHSSIRIRVNDGKANLNIKSKTVGIQRAEYDYAIPVAEAEDMLNALCDQPFIEKTRHWVPHQGHEWEIDVFAGDNTGLIVAEIELDTPDESFSLPEWAGLEVTEDSRYYNICLVTHPYCSW